MKFSKVVWSVTLFYAQLRKLYAKPVLGSEHAVSAVIVLR